MLQRKSRKQRRISVTASFYDNACTNRQLDTFAKKISPSKT